MNQPGVHQRLRVTIQRAVQGVGFRPFIYRLATDLNLVGWVNNSTVGVVIEVVAHLRTFRLPGGEKAIKEPGE